MLRYALPPSKASAAISSISKLHLPRAPENRNPPFFPPKSHLRETATMQEAKQPTSNSNTTKFSAPSSFPSTFAPNPYHLPQYGTFSPSQPAPVVGAAYHASSTGFGGQGVTAFPGTAVQQQIFVEGVPVREPPLPFFGIGIGWFLFLLGFFLAAIPWYAGAFLLFFVGLDHREKPGLIACTVAGIFALVPFILNGIRMHPFW